MQITMSDMGNNAPSNVTHASDYNILSLRRFLRRTVGVGQEIRTIRKKCVESGAKAALSNNEKHVLRYNESSTIDN